MTVCGKFPSLNLSLNLSSNLSNASKIASANCKTFDPFYREPTQRVGVIRMYVVLRVHAAPVLPLAPRHPQAGAAPAPSIDGLVRLLRRQPPPIPFPCSTKPLRGMKPSKIRDVQYERPELFAGKGIDQRV